MYSSNTKSNQSIGQELDKESLQIRITFIQAVLRKKQEQKSVHRPKIGRRNTSRLISYPMMASTSENLLCLWQTH